jgi:DNA-binding NarL/FixJ family response regulator
MFRNGRESQVSALLVSPNRQLAQSFLQAVGQNKSFMILADLKTLPAPLALEARIRQLNPEVVLIDTSVNLGLACDLIAAITKQEGAPPVVALHSSNVRRFYFIPCGLVLQNFCMLRLKSSPSGRQPND